MRYRREARPRFALDAPLKKIKSVSEIVGPYVQKRAVVYSSSGSVDEAGPESPLS
jgi:hypothetical protein